MYVFSYERASDEEIEQVEKLCCTDSDFPPKISLKNGDVQTTYSVGATHCTDRKILNYRHLFDYIPDYKGGGHKEELYTSICSVNLANNSYFEDENEVPISFLQISDEEAQRRGGGQCVAVVKDIPQSILRFEPAKPIRKELWGKPKADIFALFFRQFSFIWKSRWINSPCQISTVTTEEYIARLPLEEDCMSIIVPFRQIYSETDNLYNNACNIFKCHCPKEHPSYDWVVGYQKEFNHSLEGNTFFSILDCGINVRRYLNAFAYGASLVHVNGKEKYKEDFDYLREKYQHEMIVMEYHSILHGLMSKMSMINDVMRKNVEYWINDLGWEKPSEKPLGSGIFNS